MEQTRLIEPYLFFNGRCQEALDFYGKVLGAKVEMLMRFNENPEPAPPGRLPPGFENKIMHASFQVGGTTIMASDGCSTEPANFQGFALTLSVPTEAEARKVFPELAEGGKVTMPLTKTFYSPCFGMLEDRFGIGWMVIVPGEM